VKLRPCVPGVVVVVEVRRRSHQEVYKPITLQLLGGKEERISVNLRLPFVLEFIDVRSQPFHVLQHQIQFLVKC
jgi:hypothetical protein